MRINRSLRTLPALLVGLALLLAGCGSSNPLGSGSSASGDAGTLVIGSQQYYSNEIIAELYAQALEAKGAKVKRQYQIGQREVYMPELQSGAIDLLPEYGGNLLQYLDKAATAKTADEIAKALAAKLPQGLRALTAAPATDQDSYTVTKATADRYGLTTVADLTKVPQPIKIAGNSELATRPYGPPGLKSAYGVDATVVPVEDSGGPLTVKALVDGTVIAADIYTASPAIATNNLVTLSDPKSLILPQNVTPICSSKVTAAQANAINAVSAKLTTAELIKLNARSVDQKESSAVIAKAWLTSQGLV